MPEYFDIHSHINFPDFDSDREQVIQRMQENKVWTITVGAGRKNSEDALKVADPQKGIFACVGLHPDDDDGEKTFDFDFYKTLASDEKIVAIGECGLDYFRIAGDEAIKKQQKEIFEKQIQLSLDLDKPLMIHCRDAYGDIYEILNSYFKQFGDKLRANFHFFAGDLETAKKFLDLGFTLSFSGVITFARNYDEVIKYAPISAIMSETDCPFVAPAPFRGKRNEPVFVIEIVKKIAEIRGEPLENVKKMLVSNALKTFNIKALQ